MAVTGELPPLPRNTLQLQKDDNDWAEFTKFKRRNVATVKISTARLNLKKVNWKCNGFPEPDL
jgi:hypothetical protein